MKLSLQDQLAGLKQIHKSTEDTEEFEFRESVINTIEIIIDHFNEMAKHFNCHKHPVKVKLDSDLYEQAGSGFTGTPAEDLGFGCASPNRIDFE